MFTLFAIYLVILKSSLSSEKRYFQIFYPNALAHVKGQSQQRFGQHNWTSFKHRFPVFIWDL